MNRRILYVLNSPDTAGGAMTGILQLVRALPRNQYQAYLVVPSQPSAEQHTLLNKLFDRIAVIQMGGSWVTSPARPFHRRLLSELSINVQTLFHLSSLWRLVRIIRQWNIDLVYTSSILILEPALATKLARVPHIWHIKEHIGKNGNTQFFWPDWLVIRIIEALSSRIIVMSNFIAETFFQYGRAAKVIKVYDGIDLRDFDRSADGKSLRRLLRIQDDEFLVGLIASIDASWKKHEIFIQMAARLKEMLPKVRFVHFGHIPSPGTHHWRRYETLCRMIEEFRLRDHFVWAGVVADIPQMMDALDVLVHPCDTEPFGRVAIEAMAAGKPVVGPAWGGIAESVVNGQTGFLVEPGNPDAFAKATKHLLVNPGLRRDMECAGRARVEAHFSIQRHVLNMIEVFDEVLR